MDPKLEEAQAPVDRARAVLIYDGTCGLCQGGRLVDLAPRRPRATSSSCPARRPSGAPAIPWMDERACLQAMQLILPDGRVLAGDAAIPEILRRMRGWRWLAWAFRLPGIEVLGPLLYGWVARHRYQISCMLGRPRR